MSFVPLDTPSVRVVPKDDWDDAVDRHAGDPAYHSLAYHLAAAELEPGHAEPTLIQIGSRGDSLLLPILVRDIPSAPGLRDATSAYGYGGPLLRGSGTPTAVREVDDWAERNGIVCTFLRFHPLLGNAETSPTPGTVTAGPTFAWPISGPAELRDTLHQHHRRLVRAAESKALEVTIHVAPADLGTFISLYELTMHRQQASSFYFFSDAYWSALAQLGNRLMLATATTDGEPVAAMLCLLGDNRIHYHLGASSDLGRSVGANPLLFLRVAEWARARGHVDFHLGGGVGGTPDSPLLTFKRRFHVSAPLRTFHVGHWIHDSDQYRRLASGNLGESGYFPPWRAPCIHDQP